MARRLGMLAVVVPLLWASGCAICCAPYDYHYPTVGGRWVRDNPTHGRVGSAFEPAGHRVDELAAAAEEPTPAEGEPATGASRVRRDGASYLPTEE
jgi:hypothetical protein